jgi:hypothetical protein
MLAGTLATLYLSVGRQASLQDAVTLQAEDTNIEHSVELESLSRNRKMLEEEQDRYDRECQSDQRNSRNCLRIASSVKVYADAVKGNVSTLRDIGPAQAIQSRAAKVADALNVLFSCDRDHALKILTTFEPFLFSVLLEMGSLIAFAYAFSRHKTVTSADKQPQGSRRSGESWDSNIQQKSTPELESYSVPISVPYSGAKKGPKIRSDILNWITGYRSQYGRLPTGAVIATQFGLPISTAFAYRQRAAASNVVPLRAHS